jgi:hypothetical protein
MLIVFVLMLFVFLLVLRERRKEEGGRAESEGPDMYSANTRFLV